MKIYTMMQGGALLRGKFTLISLGQQKEGGFLASSYCSSSHGGKLCRVFDSLSSSENQLRSLDSYFQKLHNDGMQSSSRSFGKRKQSFDASDDLKAKKGLAALEEYLGKITEDANSTKYISSSSGDKSCETVPSSHVKRVYESSQLKNYRTHLQLTGVAQKISDDEVSNFYLIGLLASINIAVFLFELASPIRNSELQLFSIPMAYGAKINHLILDGEWWRLVTPMFLHSGVFHIALSCWMLMTYGPEVCRAYGSVTFFLIYVLGGLSGNLISFLHTPDPTVGGTVNSISPLKIMGPVFAIIGAWLAYQIQNRDMVVDDGPKKMLQKVIIATCLSCTLSNFGPVDDWTNVGAAFTGLAYGFLTCPTIQVDDKASESGQEEGIRLTTRYTDSCKSVVYFCLFILLWSSVFFVTDPPLYSLAGDDLNIGM
ncbi:RHOMBOID-like protein 9, chloroplastic isoform X1 [Coffea eugenioides]|uniref:RHOMBOID-like protein 9, chloroplastic isoform X1 n=1 Tax=Coffea eugenioides TaxID=49369 RepID=UPI000F609385|nr:RHOMBOID-like protein 9, chloroplastic isoform X1 [Coffea eugenioides]